MTEDEVNARSVNHNLVKLVMRYSNIHIPNEGRENKHTVKAAHTRPCNTE